MTIKSRNRITFIFFIVSVTTLLCYLLFTGYQLFTGKLIFPEVYLKTTSQSKAFTFNPYCVLISIFTIMLYVCITSYVMYKIFNKTQATDIVFLLLFLAACLLDSSRLLIPLLNVSNTFSKLLIKIGNMTLLARILAPFGLFGATVLSNDENRPNTERNCLIILIAALFFSQVIPLNTAVITPQFSVSHGYHKSINICIAMVCLISIFTLFLTNLKNEYSQIMTGGFALISLGYTCLFSSYTLFFTILGFVSLSAGTFFYLQELHKHYLWLD